MDIPIYEQRCIIRWKDAKLGYNCTSIENLFKKICEELKLRIISGPHVMHHIDNDPDKSGISGTVMFAESGMQIHIWYRYNYGVLDVFSCKAFSWRSILSIILKVFEPQYNSVVSIKGKNDLYSWG